MSIQAIKILLVGGGGALGNCFYLSPDAVSIAYVKF